MVPEVTLSNLRKSQTGMYVHIGPLPFSGRGCVSARDIFGFWEQRNASHQSCQKSHSDFWYSHWSSSYKPPVLGRHLEGAASQRSSAHCDVLVGQPFYIEIEAQDEFGNRYESYSRLSVEDLWTGKTRWTPTKVLSLLHQGWSCWWEWASHTFLNYGIRKLCVISGSETRRRFVMDGEPQPNIWLPSLTGLIKVSGLSWRSIHVSTVIIQIFKRPTFSILPFREA